MSDTSTCNLLIKQISPLLKMAAEKGISLLAVSEYLNIPVKCLSEPYSGEVSLLDYFRLLNYLALQTDDESCGISTRHTLPGTIDFSLSKLITGQNFTQAAVSLAQTTNIILGGEYNSIVYRPKQLIFAVDDQNFPYTLGDPEFIQLTMEIVLIYILAILSIVTAGKCESHLLKIYCKDNHFKNQSISTPLSNLKTPVSYNNSFYGLAFDAKAGLEPIVVAQSDLPAKLKLNKRVIAIANGESCIDKSSSNIIQQVKNALLEGVTKQADVAAKLCMSQATLKRRLSRHQVSFRSLRRDSMCELSRMLLQSGLDITAVAERLGFSDGRSFTRAFKAWNGITPTKFVTSYRRSKI